MNELLQYINEIAVFIVTRPAIEIWETLICFTFFILLLLLVKIRKTRNKLQQSHTRCNDLEKMLIIEQDAHRETQRLFEKRNEGLIRTGQKIKELRDDVNKKDLEINEQTEELIELQDWKRSIEKEKTDREREKQRNDQEIERKNKILEIMYQYYDDFRRPIFAVVDSDRCRGTYHHIQTVASLAGTAAERVQLSGSFVRAAAYFHDLGKAYHPKYFKENWGYNEDRGWRQENEEYSFYHRGQMILSHLPLGRKWVQEHMTAPPTDLMEMLAEFPGSNEWKESIFLDAVAHLSSSIEEHQGNTTILGLFLASVKNGEGTTLEDFRYVTGRKPCSKENGIILLADSCDAAFEGITLDKDTDIGDILKNVFFLKLSLGLLDETQLSITELGQIYQVFHEFFSQKYKIGDRVEEKTVEDRIFYLETKPNPIVECLEILENLAEDPVSKRKVAFYFAHHADKLYKLKQVGKLIDLMLTDLASLLKDDIHLANIIKALSTYYKLRIKDLVEIMSENDIELAENEMDLTLGDVIELPAMKDLIKNDNRCEEIIVRLEQIEKMILETIINKDILNKTDRYIYDEGLKTYHWLGRQDMVADPIEPTPAHALTTTEMEIGNQWVSLEHGHKLIGAIRGKILEITPRFRLKEPSPDLVFFNVYFKVENSFLMDMNGNFKTKNKGLVAIHSLFLPSAQVQGVCSGLPLNFPLTELHMKSIEADELTVHFQIHKVSSNQGNILLFDYQEKVKQNTISNSSLSPDEEPA
ncbi:HDIG domain-containing metalloprotein [candidate division CSSED10-310 bacterium]|uniref:HDIG domain-containing metalloprotein n=1 Tax=candidate division CSSED10-310 bacterium TaxID=2855610 RepID=A0ABV6YVY8_UNCC1